MLRKKSREGASAGRMTRGGARAGPGMAAAALPGAASEEEEEGGGGWRARKAGMRMTKRRTAKGTRARRCGLRQRRL